MSEGVSAIIAKNWLQIFYINCWWVACKHASAKRLKICLLLFWSYSTFQKILLFMNECIRMAQQVAHIWQQLWNNHWTEILCFILIPTAKWTTSRTRSTCWLADTISVIIIHWLIYYNDSSHGLNFLHRICKHNKLSYKIK